ncbi:MAG: RNase adapter RapZ [Bacteroidales bacterium]|jgi:aminoglycoside/choline kinase family phosphotransferase|nr:RNase adapter RapZ [Bacteroidales bacterium]
MEKAIKDLFYRTYGVMPNEFESLSAHGSARKYFRLRSATLTVIGAYNSDEKENLAFVSYANQLSDRGLNVPKIIAVDEKQNVYLQEDLGDLTLFDYIKTASEEDVKKIYTKIVKILPRWQVEATKGFDYTNAYPRQRFDAQSIQWDLNYFKYYFLKLAEIPFDEESLEADFAVLKDYLLNCECEYFLYRDFQSRNIMLHKNDVYFIDFQGARQGALQYDVASLLYDAKANLSEELREELLQVYLEELSKYISIDKEEFVNKYYAYVYIRIMQAMGSYGYRGYFQGKTHFLQSIPYALENIALLQKNKRLKLELPCLNFVFASMLENDRLKKISNDNYQLTINVKSFSFKKGYPQDTSGNGGGYVFDCRCLPNPGRYEEYKDKTGLDEEVIDYLEKEQEVEQFYNNAKQMVLQSVEKYKERKFTFLSVYFGCTGGRHRSVYMTQRLAKDLEKDSKLKVIIQHIEQNN